MSHFTCEIDTLHPKRRALLTITTIDDGTVRVLVEDSTEAAAVYLTEDMVLRAAIGLLQSLAHIKRAATTCGQLLRDDDGFPKSALGEHRRCTLSPGHLGQHLWRPS